MTKPTVAWNGLMFDLTAAANNPVLNEGTNPATAAMRGRGQGCRADFRNPHAQRLLARDNLGGRCILGLVSRFCLQLPTGAGGGNFFIASPGVAYANECFSTCSRGEFSVTAVVPEPATLASLGIASAAFGWLRRRACKRARHTDFSAQVPLASRSIAAHDDVGIVADEIEGITPC
jgi:hypothetical protein